MKYLIISDYRTGGAGAVAKLSSQILQDKSNECFEIWASDYFSFKPINYLYNKEAYSLVWSKLNEIKPDVVMLHNFDNLFSPLILKAIINYKSLMKLNVIMTVHDYHIISASNSLSYYKGKDKFFFDKPPSLIKLITSCLDRRGYILGLARIIQWYTYYKLLNYRRCIDIYICPSDFMHDHVKSVIKNSDIRLVHNPVNFDFNLSFDSVQSNNIINMTFVGRLTKDKGIFDFLFSLSLVKRVSENKIIIDIVGEGEYQEAIEKLVSSLALINIELVLHGHKENSKVQELLGKSDYVLLPSLCFENAPLTLIEGVYSGCNIITMNYGGMKEIADKLENSILLDDLSQSSCENMLGRIKKNSRDGVVLRKKMFGVYEKDVYYSKIRELVD